MRHPSPPEAFLWRSFNQIPISVILFTCISTNPIVFPNLSRYDSIETKYIGFLSTVTWLSELFHFPFSKFTEECRVIVSKSIHPMELFRSDSQLCSSIVHFTTTKKMIWLYAQSLIYRTIIIVDNGILFNKYCVKVFRMRFQIEAF